MICENCGYDCPQHHIRTVLMLHAGWPPAELIQMCRPCRREMRIGVKHLLLNLTVCVVLLTALLAAGFGVVQLVKCFLQNGSM